MGQHRVAVTWAVLGGLLLALFAGTVLILNATLYSASGFAGSYLAALSRHDVAAAVELAGPPSASGGAKAGRDLLDPRALGELRSIRLVSDVQQGDVHLVRYSYVMADGARKATGATTFRVERDGVRMGLFANWRFAASPLGTLTITPRHDAGFTANGLQLRSAAPDVGTRQLALTPGLYVLGHQSDYFTAEPVLARLSRAGADAEASVDVQANSVFVKQVQEGLNDQLKKCATQKVLLPTGCPFGKEIGDRIEGTPAWSIVHNPEVTIGPGPTPGTWQVPQTTGTAHLTVKVRSIFDGSVTTLDEDVPFTVGYTIGFTSHGRLVITGH
ncbi:MAG TPA: hypothetical protein VN619_10510 [Lacisediminihabitans sp.]|jgi:hypothetical protein|nr:hypothetical protein [Lacisediminihabitans sp.]HXD62343.1 hypothetical protein [Lacisediminihabitans sp.]